MKIIWLSANKLGYELLKEAVKLDGFDLKAIVTLSSKAKTIMYDGIPIRKWRKFKVETYELEDINEEKNLIKQLSPELIVICGWRQIIKEDIIVIPSYGAIGFHPTLLPFGRGPNPIINTIMQDLRESGLTMYYVGKGLDDGDIIAQAKFKITEMDHAGDVYKKIVRAGKKLIRENFPSVIQGKASGIPQDNSRVVLFEKQYLDNNKIDMERESIESIYRKIKALSKPYRGAFIEKDRKRLIIWKAELQDI